MVLKKEGGRILGILESILPNNTHPSHPPLPPPTPSCFTFLIC